MTYFMFFIMTLDGTFSGKIENW